MGKSTISMAIFNRYVKLPEGTRPGKLPHNEVERSTMLSMGKPSTNRLGHGFKFANCECLPGWVWFIMKYPRSNFYPKNISIWYLPWKYPPHSRAIDDKNRLKILKFIQYESILYIPLIWYWDEHCCGYNRIFNIKNGYFYYKIGCVQNQYSYILSKYPNKNWEYHPTHHHI